MTTIRRAFWLAALATSSAAAQGTRTDYARAEQFLGWKSQELSLNESV